LKSRTSAALGVLNQEHHQKGYNGGHGNKGKRFIRPILSNFDQTLSGSSSTL
jgi:hypothetical protein